MAAGLCIFNGEISGKSMRFWRCRFNEQTSHMLRRFPDCGPELDRHPVSILVYTVVASPAGKQNSACGSGTSSRKTQRRAAATYTTG